MLNIMSDIRICFIWRRTMTLAKVDFSQNIYKKKKTKTKREIQEMGWEKT